MSKGKRTKYLKGPQKYSVLDMEDPEGGFMSAFSAAPQASVSSNSQLLGSSENRVSTVFIAKKETVKLTPEQVEINDADANLKLPFIEATTSSDTVAAFTTKVPIENAQSIVNTLKQPPASSKAVPELGPVTTELRTSENRGQSDDAGKDRYSTEIETGNKVGTQPATNRQQTSNKPDTQPVANRQQTGNTNKNRYSTEIETGNKVGTQPATQPIANRQQSGNKPATNRVFSSLVGLQRSIVIFLYNACKAVRGRSTEALTLEHISSYLKTSPGSVKTTLQRIEEKGFIERVEFKNGRGGWSKYEIPETLFLEMLQLETDNKLATKWQQSDSKVGTQPATQPATSTPSSSSFLDLNNFKETTTSAKFELAEDWLVVNFETLREIGFTATHVTQVAQRKKLTPDLLQTSINAFAFDLKKNQKAKTITGSSPLNFFMGIVGKGNVYAPPANYETPEDEALRLYLEIQEAQAAKRQAMIQRVQDLQFDEWYSNLSSGDKVELRIKTNLPLAVNEGPMLRGAIRHNWEQEVWPMISTAIPGLTNISREEVGKLLEKSLSEAKS